MWGVLCGDSNGFSETAYGNHDGKSIFGVEDGFVAGFWCSNLRFATFRAIGNASRIAWSATVEPGLDYRSPEW